jgi:heme-degrading monooxygenase HmoA
MITFGLNYDVKEAHVNEFLEITQKVLGLMGSLEGHVDTKLYKDVNSPNSYLIYSEWETQENFKNFISSETFKNVQNMSSDMLENRPKHKIYETKKMH